MTKSLTSVIRVIALRGLGVFLSLGTAIGIAFHFGAGPLTDAFFLVRRVFGSWVLLVDSLTNALLVPVFVRQAEGQDRRRYIQSLRRREIRFFGAGLLLAGLAGLFAPGIVAVMAPGLDPAARDAAVTFFALMAITLPVTLSTAFIGAALTAVRQFSLPVAVRLAPRILILLAVLMVPLGLGMTSVVIAAVIGHAVMFLALIWVRRRVARQAHEIQETAPKPKDSTPARAGALTVLAGYFLAVTISESFAASFIGVGAIAILALGQRISTLGVSEILNSVLTVYYTTFSERAKDAAALGAAVRGALSTGLFFTAPLTLCLAVLAPTLAQLVLANGAFSDAAAAQAGALVAWFALAALVNTGMSIFETALLARNDSGMTTHFVKACGTALALRFGLMALLIPLWGLNAIGLAAALGPLVVGLWHLRFLSGQIGPILDSAVRADIIRILAAALGAALICGAVTWALPVEGKWGQTLALALSVGLAAPAYLLITRRLGLADAQTITRKLGLR